MGKQPQPHSATFSSARQQHTPGRDHSRTVQRSATQPDAAPKGRSHLPAPPVYRPQPVPRVLQPKTGGKQAAGGRATTGPRHPAAPPAYRPQPTPKVLQLKQVGGQPQPPARAAQHHRPPSAPPAYRPGPAPAGSRPAPGRDARAPAAPPAYCPPTAPQVILPKRLGPQRGAAAPPRPHPGAVVQRTVTYQGVTYDEENDSKKVLVPLREKMKAEVPNYQQDPDYQRLAQALDRRLGVSARKKDPSEYKQHTTSKQSKTEVWDVLKDWSLYAQSAVAAVSATQTNDPSSNAQVVERLTTSFKIAGKLLEEINNNWGNFVVQEKGGRITSIALRTYDYFTGAPILNFALTDPRKIYSATQNDVQAALDAGKSGGALLEAMMVEALSNGQELKLRAADQASRSFYHHLGFGVRGDSGQISYAEQDCVGPQEKEMVITAEKMKDYLRKHHRWDDRGFRKGDVPLRA